MINIQTSIRIARPRADVFALLSDPSRFPLWNSAVTAVEGRGPRYVMQRSLPTGPAENGLEVVERDAPGRFAIRTTSGPTPFLYRYSLTEAGGATVVGLDASVELDGAAGLLGPLAGRAVKRGVDANLATLRAALERD
ncbi:MAG TPA: SRPBCC family protein [Solirubrobacteraceae bacterium]|nr:SRPBCC family protein [Solirubrobacteraceae bacterium]